MADQGRERLRASIDAQARSIETHATIALKVPCGRQFLKRGASYTHRQIRVAARNWMTYPIGLIPVKEDDMVGLGDRLSAADVMNIQAAVRKNERRFASALFCALVPARAGAHDIPHR